MIDMMLKQVNKKIRQKVIKFLDNLFLVPYNGKNERF